MAFNSLEQTHDKLRQNPDISEHNKEVLNEFFRKRRSSGTGSATLQDYASRFNSLAPHIDFKLDDPEKRDLEDIVGKFNQDDIRKNNGGSYSDNSKAKFWKTLSVFYTSFIKKEGYGYKEDIDGPELLDGLKLRIEPVVKVEPDTKPEPKEVRKVAEAANSLRDKALILLGWSTGCRVGEIAVTQYDPEPIRWKHIKFKDNYMEVKISESGPNSRGKTGERTIPARIGMGVMRELYEQQNPDLEDPVFLKKDANFHCPSCENRVNQVTNSTHIRRKYECTECGWKGKTSDVDRRIEPLTASGVRTVLDRCYGRSEVDRAIDINPHAFFRKARALHKAGIGWTEYQLRGFFGWSENSDAPKHYITIVKEGLVAAMKQEFGEGVINEDLGFNEDEHLKPVDCTFCGEINSALNDYCRKCDKELDKDLREHNKTPSERRAEEMEETLIDMATEAGMDEEAFRSLVRKNMS